MGGDKSWRDLVCLLRGSLRLNQAWHKRVSTGLDVNVNVNAFRRVCFGPF